MKFILSILFIMTSSCTMWPTLTQPNITFEVLDKNNTAIQGAQLNLETYTYPYARLNKEANFKANSSGVIEIPSIRNWELQNYLFPHGVRVYSWYYCIWADGYEPIIKALWPREVPNDKIVINLEESKKNYNCPDRLDSINTPELN